MTNPGLVGFWPAPVKLAPNSYPAQIQEVVDFEGFNRFQVSGFVSVGSDPRSGGAGEAPDGSFPFGIVRVGLAPGTKRPLGVSPPNLS